MAMLTEAPRRRHVPKVIEKLPHISEEKDATERSPTNKSTLQLPEVTSYFSQLIPESESGNFDFGVEYAEKRYDLDGYEKGIPEETIRSLATTALNAARERNKFDGEFDFTEIIEKRKGREFLDPILRNNSDIFPDLSDHFQNIFNNPYSMLGARLVMTLYEWPTLNLDQTPPKKLEPDKAFFLQSA